MTEDDQEDDQLNIGDNDDEFVQIDPLKNSEIEQQQQQRLPSEIRRKKKNKKKEGCC